VAIAEAGGLKRLSEAGLAVAIGLLVTHAVHQVLPRALQRRRAACPQLDISLSEMSNAEQARRGTAGGGRTCSSCARDPESPCGTEAVCHNSNKDGHR